MRYYRKLALLTSTIGLLACATSCTKNIAPPENALETPEALHQAIDTRLSQVSDARFKEVVLDYFGKDKRVKVRQLILVDRPDRLRVQTRLPGSDEIMSLLVTDDQQFAMHKRDTNEYFTGPPTPRNISRLLPVDLSATDVVRVMLGGAPWDRFNRARFKRGAPATLQWDSETGRYTYTATTAGGATLSMQVRPTDYAVVSIIQRNAAGDMTYKYTTDDWQRFDGVALPTYRRFVWPDRDLDFSLDVGETQVDPTLDDALFQLPPPPGSKIIRLR